LSRVSLVPWIRGEEVKPHPPVISQKFQPARKAKLAMVQWPHKIIWNIPHNTWELYDLAEDPNERNNLARDQPPRGFAKLKHTLKAWRATVGERTSQVGL
jgi:arylsulfatase A-like enzyme